MSADRIEAVRKVAAATPGLELLVLFGSRGRGDAVSGSDWDFAVRGTAGLDLEMLSAQLASAVATNDVDVVELDRAGGLLRYRVARDGIPLYQASPRAFERFWLDAVDFWCDARQVLEPAYEDVLSRNRR